MKKNKYSLREIEPKPINLELEERITHVKSIISKLNDHPSINEISPGALDRLEIINKSNLSLAELNDLTNKKNKLKEFIDNYHDSRQDELLPKLREKLRKLESEQEYEPINTQWELIDTSDSKETIIVNFAILLNEDIYEVYEIDPNHYGVIYFNWTEQEVQALVNNRGKLIVKDILDFEILKNGHIIIYASGLKDDMGYEEDRYISVIDGSGNTIIEPILNGSVKYIAKKNHYEVNDFFIFDTEGNKIDK
jgi:hypothetical protein